MKAYYIHWDYPTTADDTLYYSGTDDKKLFHHKENAQKYMEEELKDYLEVKGKVKILLDKQESGIITKEENNELQELVHTLLHFYSDSPCTGTVCEREIIFED